MIKFNNQISVKLSDQESNFLIKLLNEKFELNSFSDAIRYCIRKEMQQKNSKELYTSNWCLHNYPRRRWKNELFGKHMLVK